MNFASLSLLRFFFKLLIFKGFAAEDNRNTGLKATYGAKLFNDTSR